MEVLSNCLEFFGNFSWFGPFTDWIRNLAIIIGVILAWRQVGQWKIEKTATKKSELGEELVAVTNELHAKITTVRNPSGYGPPIGEKDDGTFDFFRRINELNDLGDDFAKLQHLKIRARAWIGDSELSDDIDTFFKARSDLHFALGGTISNIRRNDKYGRSLTKRDIARGQEYDEIIWETGSDVADPISSKIDPALERIEQRMIPIIRLETKP